MVASGKATLLTQFERFQGGGVRTEGDTKRIKSLHLDQVMSSVFSMLSKCGCGLHCTNEHYHYNCRVKHAVASALSIKYTLTP